MSPALAEIVALSEQLQQLAGQQNWPAMLDIGHTRQQQLAAYFSGQPLADEPELIREVLTKIQQTDAVMMKDAGTQRQKLLQDAVDLRQRWQMSTTYQSVQNLKT